MLRKNVLPSIPASTIRGKSAIFLKQSSSGKSESKSEENVKVQDKIEAGQKTNKTGVGTVITITCLLLLIR